MTWIRRSPRKHLCKLPRGSLFPDGENGDVWRCDDCKKLWVITRSQWCVAGPILRFKFRKMGRDSGGS